jgi:hypothetical protein
LARQQRSKPISGISCWGSSPQHWSRWGPCLIPLPDDPSGLFTRGTFAAYLMTAWLIALYVVYFRYRTFECDVSGLRTDYKRSCPASGILGKGFSRSSRFYCDRQIARHGELSTLDAHMVEDFVHTKHPRLLDNTF